MTTFTIEMLPARNGDALWIEYGEHNAALKRMMIDAGPIEAWSGIAAKYDAMKASDRALELLVVTHVDTDHIEGVIRTLAPHRAKWSISPKDIWFNGYKHMRPDNTLGGKQGEYFSALLEQRAKTLWNRAFKGKAVVVPDHGGLPTVELAGGMVLTLLSPTPAKLQTMAGKWAKDIDAWKTAPGDLSTAWDRLARIDKYLPDTGLTLGPADITAKLRQQLDGHDSSDANGSSIAFLATLNDKSCLFLADAHMDVICASIRRLIPSGKTTLNVDAVKVSHHGSLHNITAEFMTLVDAKHFLFSSSGAKHRHPDKDAVDIVIVGSRQKAHLWFNYDSPFTSGYRHDPRHGDNFIAHYPEPGSEGITVEL